MASGFLPGWGVMMMSALIPGLLVAVVTLTGTFLINMLQTWLSNRRAARREAYDNFYIPFIALLYSADVWNLNFSELPERKQVEFYKLIIENIRYMDDSILEWVDVFYGHLSDFLFGKRADTLDAGLLRHLDEVFACVVESVLKRANGLAKKIHQPQLGGHALKLYQETGPHIGEYSNSPCDHADGNAVDNNDDADDHEN